MSEEGRQPPTYLLLLALPGSRWDALLWHHEQLPGQ